jgi:hypothetical protein
MSTLDLPTSSDPWREMRPTFLRWRKDLRIFVREALSVTPEPWQDECLAALSVHDRIALRSGHGVGKTSVLSWIVLGWLLTRFPAKIPCTAPTAHQLEDVLWGEIGKWYRTLHPFLQGLLELKRDRIELTAVPTQSFAVARTARREQPEAFQGFHAENLLFIADEASGIDDLIFEVGEGAMSTPKAKTILAGNPTRISGYFFEAFNRRRSFWHVMHVPCQRSGRVDPEYIERMAQTYGPESDIYRVRVLGEFPRAEVNQFIAPDIVEGCLHYTAEGFDTQPVVLGVDVARFGDDKTVIRLRQGRKVGRAWKYRGKDTMETAALVADLVQEHKPQAVFVDGGGVGGGVVDRLKQLVSRRLIIEVNGGSEAHDPVTYFNKRAEMWGRMRDYLKAGAQLPNDRELTDDLSGPEYGFSAKQQIQLERKEDMKRRGLASPDDGDALALTFAELIIKRGPDFGPPPIWPSGHSPGGPTTWMGH